MPRRHRDPADCDQGRARDELLGALDALARRLPAPDEPVQLMTLNARAFAPGTCAARLCSVLWRLAAAGRPVEVA